MKVAVTSTIILEVTEADLDTLRRDLLDSNRFAIDRPLETVTGRVYIMRAIERLDVKLRDS